MPEESFAAGGDSAVALVPAAPSDPTLELLARQLVEMAQELHRHLLDDPSLVDVAPLVGGAARMQDLLDELRGAASTDE